MNKEQALKANTAAAELLGLISPSYGIWITPDGFEDEAWEFDIFTNPADCLDVVKKLGEEHGIAITFYNGHEQWIAEAVSVVSNFSSLHDTYEQAVGSAVLEVTK